MAVLADAVRLRDLGEREGLRDREREAPGLDQFADPGDRVDRAAGLPDPAGDVGLGAGVGRVLEDLLGRAVLDEHAGAGIGLALREH